MLVVLAIAALAILACVVVVSLGKGGELGEFPPDVPPLGLPEAGQLTAVDFMALQLPVNLVGYHTQSVDESLRRAANAIRARDTRIAVLEQRVSELLASRLQARQEAYASPGAAPRTDHRPTAPSVALPDDDEARPGGRTDEDDASLATAHQDDKGDAALANTFAHGDDEDAPAAGDRDLAPGTAVPNAASDLGVGAAGDSGVASSSAAHSDDAGFSSPGDGDHVSRLGEPASSLGEYERDAGMASTGVWRDSEAVSSPEEHEGDNGASPVVGSDGDAGSPARPAAHQDSLPSRRSGAGADALAGEHDSGDDGDAAPDAEREDGDAASAEKVSRSWGDIGSPVVGSSHAGPERASGSRDGRSGQRASIGREKKGRS
ncbi:hypothetical protein [Nonomuraea sp. NPDC003804]|uniref:hypothetical protein n=1 Tax=Nonomuraea sp. NPDC003804 TaxID=3154547 RepID=UPI0033AC168A